MRGRFRAFSFVDRITRLDPAMRVEGSYTVPGGVTRFPASLMAEAVGQLAAWAAMTRLDYMHRPVAGLAAETRYHGAVVPGQTMQLAADIDRCDDEAISYSGTASVGDRCMLELEHCVGPMLPMAEFDDPASVRGDFDTLCGAGAATDRFLGVDAPDIEIGEHTPRERIRALLHVPTAAPYFDDHFPRRPVYPGMLLMDALTQLVLPLARDLPAFAVAAPAVTRVCDVKIRSFTAPGQTLELAAEVQSADEQSAQLKVSARTDGKLVANARMELARSDR